MMKQHAFWSIALLSGLMASLPSAQHAQGQTTFVYSPPAYRTAYYGPRTVYAPAYPAYRPTFLQAFFAPLTGYYPAYGYPAAYYSARTRAAYYAPYALPVVGRVPVTPSYEYTPCPTACSPCGTNDGNSSSAEKTHKPSPVPDKNASKSAVGQPRTYSHRKPPLPDVKSKSKSIEKAKPPKKTEKPGRILVPSGDSPFEPTRPRKKKAESPAFPEPRTSATGNPRKREARKLAPPVVIQQRKSKRPPVAEPANENDPFGRRKTNPAATPTPTEKKPATSTTTSPQPIANVRPLHLDRRIVWRVAPRRIRLVIRSPRFATPTVERAFQSNQHWVSMPHGHQVAGPAGLSQ